MKVKMIGKTSKLFERSTVRARGIAIRAQGIGLLGHNKLSEIVLDSNKSDRS